MDGGVMQPLLKQAGPFTLVSYISRDTGSFHGRENWRVSVYSVHTLLGLKMPLLLQRIVIFAVEMNLFIAVSVLGLLATRYKCKISR
jgi:hypothetical protein